MTGQAIRRGDRDKNLVGFQVGEVHYAVQIGKVREIINPLPTVDLPHAPPAVEGVADHRGDVVPVLDLRIRFGLERRGRTRRTKWVIVDVMGRAVGLVVDNVTDVFGATVDEERAVPQLGTGDDVRGIESCFMYQGELVFVIDTQQVGQAAAAIDVSALNAVAGRAP